MKTVSKLFLSIFLLNTLIISIFIKPAFANEEKAEQTLLILGDSLSAGYGIAHGKNWTDLLQSRLSHNNQFKEIQIVNASISGDTTANGLNRLPQALKKHQPAWVIIELGANDGLRGLAIAHITNNLEALIKNSLESGAEVLLMEIKIPPNYGKKYTQVFNNIYHKLAKQYALTLLPFMLDEVVLNSELMQADGLHPNEKAQIVISENLWQALEPELNKNPIKQ